MLHSRTRLVKTYDKQRTRVVNVHQDFWDLQAEDAEARQRSKPALASPTLDSNTDAAASGEAGAHSLSKTDTARAPRRPVLATKPSQVLLGDAHDDAEWEEHPEPPLIKGRAAGAATDKAARGKQRAVMAEISEPKGKPARRGKGGRVIPAAPVSGAGQRRPVRDSRAAASPTALGFIGIDQGPLDERPDDGESSPSLATAREDDTSGSVAPPSPLTELPARFMRDSSQASALPTLTASSAGDISTELESLPARRARPRTTRKVARARRKVPSSVDASTSVSASGSDRLTEAVAQGVEVAGVQAPGEDEADADVAQLVSHLGALEVTAPLRQTRNRRRVAAAAVEASPHLDIGTASRLPRLEESSAARTADGLSALLGLCDQAQAIDFDGFLALPSLDSGSSAGTNAHVHARTARGARNRAVAPPPAVYNIIKVGEASFSEVYAVSRADGGGDGDSERQRVIVKVVPLRDVYGSTATAGAEDEEIALSDARDVVREIRISQIMAGMGSGFVAFKSAHVVQGRYPERLLSAWDVFEEDYGTHSCRPGKFADQQLYALILLADGGIDLEHFRFAKSSGWRQALGVWWQVVRAIARAEERGRFEHRDLHEGQVLIKAVHVQQDAEAPPTEPSYCGLQATVADFGLSRVDTASGDQPIWTPIPEDVFEGVGEQWAVYRRMRDLVQTRVTDASDQGAWGEFYSQTNVMWLHHLLRAILLSTESLHKPKSAAVRAGLAKRDATRSPMRQRHIRACSVVRDAPEITEGELDEQTCYASLVDLELQLRVAAGFEDALKKPRGRGRAADSLAVKSAQSILEWAEGRAFL